MSVERVIEVVNCARKNNQREGRTETSHQSVKKCKVALDQVHAGECCVLRGHTCKHNNNQQALLPFNLLDKSSLTVYDFVLPRDLAGLSRLRLSPGLDSINCRLSFRRPGMSSNSSWHPTSLGGKIIQLANKQTNSILFWKAQYFYSFLI